ncbi:DUF805 domain-containing protein [Radiobacillus sp. PE A8.2]|uniref:DUF805 domain-containing protein n=1 Tax=Radiobacillus sp. PE A8.2 TaxID=3380349 RepID=UPI00388F3BF7
MDWYLHVLRKYAVFEGRARRTEYWMFTLINIIIGIIFSIMETIYEGIVILSAIYYLAIIIPGLAVTVRRLHDIGKSGWWYFIGFIPLVGPIILLVFTCLDSEEGYNSWGPNPKI